MSITPREFEQIIAGAKIRMILLSNSENPIVYDLELVTEKYSIITEAFDNPFEAVECIIGMLQIYQGIISLKHIPPYFDEAAKRLVDTFGFVGIGPEKVTIIEMETGKFWAGGYNNETLIISDLSNTDLIARFHYLSYRRKIKRMKNIDPNIRQEVESFVISHPLV